MIVRPITDDGMVGYDKFDQLVLGRKEGEWTSFTFIWDVRRATCCICERGWEPTAASMADQTTWRLMDERVHESCLIRHIGLNERREFFDALVAARVRFRGLVPEPNRYWGNRDPWGKKPWYHAELHDYPARFVLGWRKRVAHVEVVPEGGTKLEWWKAAQEAFAEADVTKHFGPDSVLLHAWGDNAASYVRRLAEVADYVETDAKYMAREAARKGPTTATASKTEGENDG